MNKRALHVVDRGTKQAGPVLVFLHYFAGSSRAWDQVIDRLSPGSRCVAIDAAGFGESAPSGDDFSVSAMADDVTGTLSAIHIDSYALIGHSMGGKTAWLIASRRPPALASLVLVAPSPPTPEPIPEPERVRLLAAFHKRAAAERTARERAARPLDDAARNLVIDDALRTSHWAWRGWLECGSREDISRDASAIDVPALVIAGALDAPLSPAFLDGAVRQGIRGARLAVIPDAAHLLPLEAPDAIASLIAAHCIHEGAAPSL